MIEVVFSDSAKGAMRVAKAYDKEGMSDAAVAYVGKEPSKKEKRELADGEAVGGSPQDVVCIGAHLDMGDISGEITGEARKRAFAQAFVSVRFEDCEVERFFKRQREDLEKLFASAKAGGRIRVWTSSAPFSACGFAFLCDALRSIACKISVIALPEYGAVALPAYFEKPDRALLWADWSQVWPGMFHLFLPLEREVPDIEKQRQSDRWNALKAENAPLRALVNGKLISVPEDFYDHILIRNIPDGEFVMARLIGTVLGKYDLGVGDGWYALRIKEMIAENKLEIVSDADASHPYGKVLRKAPAWRDF